MRSRWCRIKETVEIAPGTPKIWWSISVTQDQGQGTVDTPDLNQGGEETRNQIGHVVRFTGALRRQNSGNTSKLGREFLVWRTGGDGGTTDGGVRWGCPSWTGCAGGRFRESLGVTYVVVRYPSSGHRHYGRILTVCFPYPENRPPPSPLHPYPIGILR